MGQRPIDKVKEDRSKSTLYPILFRRRIQTHAGLEADFNYSSFFEQTPEKILLELEEMWEKGGFTFWLNDFAATYFDPKANDIVYQFWRDKVLLRIQDPVKWELLAPAKKMYPYGTKRPCREQSYYDVCNLPHVEIVNMHSNPILEVTEKGVKTQDGVEHELDVLVLATGFDAVTGANTSIDIKGTDEEPEKLGDKWKREGAKTFFAMASNGYPNLFFVYGPQGPTGNCVGTTCAELQSDYLLTLLNSLRSSQSTRIEATSRAQENYTNLVNHVASLGLGLNSVAEEMGEEVKCWWNGSNIEDKPVQALNFHGGVPKYRELWEKCKEGGWEGFVIQ